MTYGMTCPKCGLMQLAGPTCKSCGTSMGGPVRPKDPPNIQAPRATPPPPKPPQSPPSRSVPSEAGAGRGQLRQLSFHGSGGSLFGIHLVNTFLTIISLGIYYFWAKVKVRKYLLSESEFEGDRFAYHGTGQELLIGFLKILVFFALPLFFLGILRGFLVRMPGLSAVIGLVTYIAVLILIPYAIVGARRYRLSRTSWREIRFSFRGGVRDFIRLFLTGGLLSSITLGLYYPFFETRRHGFMISHSYFGNQRFDFDGKGRDLFGSFLLAIFLSIPTLGLIWFWYQAKKQRYYWGHTSFATARFRSTVNGTRLFLLNAGNLVLLIITLGLAFPWVMVRNARFAFRYLFLQGPLDLSGIQQEAQVTTATGEALAGFLDAGLDMG